MTDDERFLAEQNVKVEYRIDFRGEPLVEARWDGVVVIADGTFDLARYIRDALARRTVQPPKMIARDRIRTWLLEHPEIPVTVLPSFDRWFPT